MTSLNLTREEFAAKRRGEQDDLVERLQGVIGATFSTGDIDPLIAALLNAYTDIYGREVNDPQRRFDANPFVRNVKKMLSHANEESDVHATALALANYVLNYATNDAYKRRGIEMEWVSMQDQDVRHTHEEADGQRQLPGKKFTVGDSKMQMPGDITAPISEWINCRCSLKPVSLGATTALTAALVEMQGEGSLEVGEALFLDAVENGVAVKVGVRDDGATLYDLNPTDLWHGSERNDNPLGESMTDLTAATADPETQPIEEMPPVDEAPVDEAPADQAPTVDTRIPWHGVLAPENTRSGDGRMFTNLGRTRPLPMPLTWQEVSDEGHDSNITVAMIEKVQMIDGLMEASGHFLASVDEADETIGLIAEFGRFGVSVDADDIGSASFDETTQTETYNDPRISAACIVGIPAFPEAYVAIGPHPILDADQANGDLPVSEAASSLPLLKMAGVPESFKQAALAKVEAEEAALAAENADAEAWVDITSFKDLAPGVTEDGPGWLTHPVDTDRLRDYWVRGPGAAKIAWGVAGDFNRCRLNVAEYVKPQYLNGYCANRHYDALHVWPGQEHLASDTLSSTKPAPALTLVASGQGPGWSAPSEFFSEPVECDPDDGVHIDPPNEDGLMRTYGYVAEWGVCHIGYDGMCKEAPPSASNYAFFRTGQVNTPDGPVKTGRLTAGTGHANPRIAAMPAAAHYDDTGSAWAFVASGENDRGIWFSGLVKPGTPEELLNDVVASGRISGDWRPIGNDLELVAGLTVNVPGFPIQPTTTSASDGRQLSLVAAGVPAAKVEESPTIVMQDLQPEAMSMIASLVVDEIEARKTRRARMDELKEKVGT